MKPSLGTFKSRTTFMARPRRLALSVHKKPQKLLFHPSSLAVPPPVSLISTKYDSK